MIEEPGALSKIANLAANWFQPNLNGSKSTL
jgi:hypothetical protein